MKVFNEKFENCIKKESKIELNLFLKLFDFNSFNF